MKKTMKVHPGTCLTAVLISVLLSGPAAADALDDAVAAMNRNDITTARLLSRPLAEQGNTRAEHILGNTCLWRQDYVEAVKWYRLAADQGDPWAQQDLASMYWDGLGVPKSDVEAYKWFNLAVANETRPILRDLAEENRNNVAHWMTREQIAEAQKLSREWKPKQ